MIFAELLQQVHALTSKVRARGACRHDPLPLKIQDSGVSCAQLHHLLCQPHPADAALAGIHRHSLCIWPLRMHAVHRMRFDFTPGAWSCFYMMVHAFYCRACWCPAFLCIKWAYKNILTFLPHICECTGTDFFRCMHKCICTIASCYRYAQNGANGSRRWANGDQDEHMQARAKELTVNSEVQKLPLKISRSAP